MALSNQDVLDARAVVIATGARYRKLPLEGWSDYEGRGIYYAATEIEARACASRRVSVVGGANSAARYMQSFEPGEDWFWDFETDEYAAGPQLVPPLHHPEDQPAPGPAGAVPQDWVQRLHR